MTLSVAVGARGGWARLVFSVRAWDGAGAKTVVVCAAVRVAHGSGGGTRGTGGATAT